VREKQKQIGIIASSFSLGTIYYHKTTGKSKQKKNEPAILILALKTHPAPSGTYSQEDTLLPFGAPLSRGETMSFSAFMPLRGNIT
jgi:hypothetical protein